LAETHQNAQGLNAFFILDELVSAQGSCFPELVLTTNGAKQSLAVSASMEGATSITLHEHPVVYEHYLWAFQKGRDV
jgi:hypothetical protein